LGPHAASAALTTCCKDADGQRETVIECGVPTLTAHLLSSLSCIHSGVRFRALHVGQPLKGGHYSMVSNCANPECGKPLHYLRDGRIYIFDANVGITRPGQKHERCLEHYWLCGKCAETLMLSQSSGGIIRIVVKPDAILESDERFPDLGSKFAS
jgi:hypothetical protein